jgi:hypothetical protein
MTPEYGGTGIVIDITAAEPTKTSAPQQIVVPAAEAPAAAAAAAAAIAAPITAPAGTVVSDSVAPPAAAMGVPIGFGPSSDGANLKP